jgi:gliding motility-associated-like protein
MKKFLPSLFFLLLFLSTNAQVISTSFGSANKDQVGFLENRGQVRDLKGQKVENVLYSAELGGQRICLTRSGLSILLSRVKSTSMVARQNNLLKGSMDQHSNDSVSLTNFELERIDISLEGAVIREERIETREDQTSPLFYLYLDSNSANNPPLRLKKEVLVKNVYPGIDWRLSISSGKGKDPKMKYDFIIHSGADASKIQLRYSKNCKLELEGEELIGRAKMGMIKEEKPYSFLKESGDEVTVKFKAKNNRVQFQVNEYDKNKTLVIDPTIYWLTYISSNNSVVQYQSIAGCDIETDKAGNIFVQFSAEHRASFPTVNPGGGAYYQDYKAQNDGSMMIGKFTPAGKPLWFTYFGNSVGGKMMTIDKDDNLIVIGVDLAVINYIPYSLASIPLLNNGGYYDPGRKSYFIAKFSNSGELKWSSWFLYFGSQPTDMSYDNFGNIYVTGWSRSHDFPVVDPGGGAYMVKNAKFGADEVFFITQFDLQNNITWSTRIEGNSTDPYARVCTDLKGNIYLGGNVRSSNFPTVDAGGYYDNTGWGSVIARFNPARQLTWSTYIPYPFLFADLTVDDSSNLYVATSKDILKFDQHTNMVFKTSVPTSRMHFWKKINYDRFTDNIQLLGVMNDEYLGFPTLNTACNGSFYRDDSYTNRKYLNATGPIFATINHSGEFSYRSLVDWKYEYYHFNEMTVDANGNLIYLFGHIKNSSRDINHQLTDPGNGAYFDNQCCYNSGSVSSMLLKLTPSELAVDIETTDATGCNCNASVRAIIKCGQAPFRYQWSTGDTTESVSGLCPGNYQLKVTDANNLSRTLKIDIPFPPESIRGFDVIATPENCNKSNGTIKIEGINGGTAPYQYSINERPYQIENSFTGLDSGYHVLQVKDKNGCSFRQQVLVGRVSGPQKISVDVKSRSCKAPDGEISVLSTDGETGPFQYALNNINTNNSGLFTGVSQGNYLLSVIDTAGCSLDTSLFVPFSIPPASAEITVSEDHCESAIGMLTVKNIRGGKSPYLISIDSLNFFSDTIKGLSAGIYKVLVQDDNGCNLSIPSNEIKNEAGPVSMDVNVSHAICGKLTGEVAINSVQGGVAPFMFRLDDGTLSASTNFRNIPPGEHTISVVDIYGCSYTIPIQINFIEQPKFNLLPADTTICYDQNAELRITGDEQMARQIVWNIPAQGNKATIRTMDNKIVTVSITDENNCVQKDTSYISVKPCNPPERCMSVPNAFSPNMDGKNEMIRPVANGCRITGLIFRVYNRWGQILFETSEPGKGWSGYYNNILQPSDTYIYALHYTADDGVPRQQKGTFLLMK